MKKTLIAGLASVALAFVLVDTANATFADLGAPVDNGSWYQPFQENGIYGGKLQSFDRMTATIISGNPFQGTGLTAVGWTSWNSVDNLIASITSPNPVSPTPSALFNFTARFSSASGTKPPFVMDQQIWLGSTLVGWQRSEWTGTAWRFAEIPVPVPEPTTMIAGALLLLPFAASTIRRMRKNS